MNMSEEPKWEYDRSRGLGFERREVMSLIKAIKCCAVREAVFRKGKPKKRYYKNHAIPIWKRVPWWDKLRCDWAVYDPRDEDNCSLFSFND